MSKKRRKMKVATTAKAEKAASAEKVPIIARGALEALVGKKAKYTGHREKFSGTLVEVRAVRKEERYGYDARVKFSDGKTMYVSPASLRPA